MCAPLRRLVLLSLACCGLTAAVGTAPAAAACGPGSKMGFAKIELWPDADCTGGSVALGMKAEDDVPNLVKFPNYDGRVLDVNNSRSSMALASGDSSTVFYPTGTSPSTFCVVNLNDTVSSMRVCPNGERGQCNRTPSATPPTDIDETPDTDAGGLPPSTSKAAAYDHGVREAAR